MLLDILQSAANRLLAMDPETTARLQSLNGKIIALEIKHPDQQFQVQVSGGQLQFTEQGECKADVTLCGSLLAFITTARNGEVGNGIEVEGDVETGQVFAHLLQNLDIDWEEQISHVIGDLPAHQLGRIRRSFKDWAAQARTTVAQDLGEYLTEERRDLEPNSVVERFLADVDTLRSDAERLVLRVQRLQRAIDENP